MPAKASKKSAGPKRTGLDDAAEKLGAVIAYRQKRGPTENAVIRFKGAKPDWAKRPIPPEVIAASNQLQRAFETVLHRMKAERASKELIAEVMAFAKAAKTSYEVSMQAFSDMFGQTLDGITLMNKESARATGELRVKNNPAAREKADAKAEAESLWNVWMDTKARRSWTNEKFAMEALRQWPGKIGSIAVVVGWIPGWKRARAAKGASK